MIGFLGLGVMASYGAQRISPTGMDTALLST